MLFLLLFSCPTELLLFPLVVRSRCDDARVLLIFDEIMLFVPLAVLLVELLRAFPDFPPPFLSCSCPSTESAINFLSARGEVAPNFGSEVTGTFLLVGSRVIVGI